MTDLPGHRERRERAISNYVRELRNVAYNKRTPALMDDARRRVRTSLLWSETDRFLSQLLVEAVLRERGERHPDVLCERFLRAPRSRLLASHSS